MTECVVKPLCVVKVTGSKPTGTKNPTMLRVGVAQAGCRSPGDFDGLDAPESWFLKPRVNLLPTGPHKLTNKKK
jgi:hypothetical protein